MSVIYVDVIATGDVQNIVTALAIHFIHLFSLRLFACNCLIHIVNMLVRVRKRLSPNRMCVSFADHSIHKYICQPHFLAWFIRSNLYQQYLIIVKSVTPFS